MSNESEVPSWPCPNSDGLLIYKELEFDKDRKWFDDLEKDQYDKDHEDYLKNQPR